MNTLYEKLSSILYIAEANKQYDRAVLYIKHLTSSINLISYNSGNGVLKAFFLIGRRHLEFQVSSTCEARNDTTTITQTAQKKLTTPKNKPPCKWLKNWPKALGTMEILTLF